MGERRELNSPPKSVELVEATSDKPDLTLFKIKNELGEEIGYFELKRSTWDGDDYVEHYVHINEDKRGEGYGTMAHIKLAELLKERGMKLKSSRPMQPGVRNIWEKMVKDGKAKKRPITRGYKSI